MKVLAISISMIFVVGCVTGPKYERPAVTVPSDFKEWKTAHPSDDTIHGKWWEMYSDPDLNSLEERVNLSNQNIAQAFAAFQQARAIVKEARAQYFPTASVVASASVQSSQTGQQIVSPGASSPLVVSPSNTQYIVAADATWAPDLWGRISNLVKQDIANAQVSAADLENQRLIQQATLAINYYELRSQDVLIQLYRDTIDAYKKSLQLTKNLFVTGIDSDEAVAQAETQLATTEAVSTNLGVLRAQYEHSISVLVGQPASSFSIAAKPFKADVPNIPCALPSELLERRPDIAAAERGMVAANAQIGVATAAYFPTLALTGNVGIGASSIGALLSAPTLAWSVGASLTELVFDAGLRSATVEQYRANFDQTVANYRQTVLTAFQQVEDSLSGLRILETQLNRQNVAIQASERFFKIALRRFRLGLDPYLNVLTAQISLLSNRQTAVNVQMQKLVASVQLIEALGGGWDSAKIPTIP